MLILNKLNYPPNNIYRDRKLVRKKATESLSIVTIIVVIHFYV